MEGNFCFKVDWATIAGSGKEIYYFCFVLLCICKSKFQVQASWGAYIRRGDLTEGFLHYNFDWLIHGGAYFWNFMVQSTPDNSNPC